MSVKFQVTLPESLMAQMKVESRRMKIPVAELVRQAVQERLHRRRPTKKVSFFESIRGLAIDCEDTDLASRVDEIYD